jgi:hypothetical protein
MVCSFESTADVAWESYEEPLKVKLTSRPVIIVVGISSPMRFARSGCSSVYRWSESYLFPLY